MKQQLSFVSFISVALFIVLCFGCRKSADTTKAEDHFRAELSQGQVRVVLLRVGPVASSTNLSTFVVTYGVEVPTNGAFSDLRFSSNEEVALVLGGKPMDTGGAVSSGSMGFGELPRQNELRKPALQEGKAMLFEDVTLTGPPIEAQQVGIRIRFSWRGTPLSFEFQNVPVPYRSGERPHENN